MLTSPTLTADEFKAIHNALCLARADNVEETVSTIREALSRVYEEEELVFNSQMDHFSAAQKSEGFISVWSEYDVTDIRSAHPYPADAVVVYDTYESVIRVPVEGPTWLDVWRASEKAILKGGDRHHIFIEKFDVKNRNELHLWTGS